MKKKKKPLKNVKPIYNDNSCNVGLSWDIKKNVEQSKKIKPQNVFEGYNKKSSKCDCGCKSKK